MAYSREVDVSTAMNDFVLLCLEDVGDDPEDLRQKLRQKNAEVSVQVRSRAPGICLPDTMQVTPSEEKCLAARADLAKFFKLKTTEIDREDPSIPRALSDSWHELWRVIPNAAQFTYERFKEATDRILNRGHSGGLADVVGRTWCLVAGLRRTVLVFKKMVDDGFLTADDCEMKQKTLKNHVTTDINTRGVVWRDRDGQWVSLFVGLLQNSIFCSNPSRK